MIPFYKEAATGLFYVNGKYIPAGSCTLEVFNSDTVISIKSINNEETVLGATLITQLEKESTAAYTNLSDLLTDVGDFFFKVEPISDIVEIETAETNTTLVLKPDGTGGVEWGTDSSLTLTDGEGTTANGTAVDLGGTTTNDILITQTGSDYDFQVYFDGTSHTRNFHLRQNNGGLYFTSLAKSTNRYTEMFSGNGTHTWLAQLNGGSNYNYMELSYANQFYLTIDDGATSVDLTIDPNSVTLEGLPTGATQVAAGAAVNELWVTSSHATLPDGVLMIGL